MITAIFDIRWGRAGEEDTNRRVVVRPLLIGHAYTFRLPSKAITIIASIGHSTAVYIAILSYLALRREKKLYMFNNVCEMIKDYINFRILYCFVIYIQCTA